MRRYPIIGGPLDGKAAREADFYEHVVAKQDYAGFPKGHVIRQGGLFADYRDQYVGFNRASRYSASGAPPTRIWLHKALLPK